MKNTKMILIYCSVVTVIIIALRKFLHYFLVTNNQHLLARIINFPFDSGYAFDILLGFILCCLLYIHGSGSECKIKRNDVVIPISIIIVMIIGIVIFPYESYRDFQVKYLYAVYRILNKMGVINESINIGNDSALIVHTTFFWHFAVTQFKIIEYAVVYLAYQISRGGYKIYKAKAK